jgi:hypothetical protein
MKVLRKTLKSNIIGLVCCLGLQTFASSKTLLISDIDDTIKATGIHQYTSIGINAPSTINEFAGMSILYNSWYKKYNKTGDIFYLTAAPGILDILGVQFLEASGFPPGFVEIKKHVVSGRSAISESSGEFKTRKLIELFEKEKPDTLILVGDNGEQDIIANDNLMKYAQDTKATTKIYSFIHYVYEAESKSLPIPSNQSAFLTSADLAVHFYNKGWINKTSLSKNLEEVAYDSNPNSKLTETVIPAFMECKNFNSWPELNLPTANDQKIVRTYLQIQANLASLCN